MVCHDPDPGVSLLSASGTSYRWSPECLTCPSFHCHCTVLRVSEEVLAIHQEIDLVKTPEHMEAGPGSNWCCFLMLNLSYVVNGCKKYFLLCIEQFVLMCKKVFTGQTNKHIKECFVKKIISYIKKNNNVHKHFSFIYTCEYAKQKYKMYRKYSGLFTNKLHTKKWLMYTIYAFHF